ncbi:MAG: hypothetical protein ACRD2L_21900 [Terriglobia bacterium]
MAKQVTPRQLEWAAGFLEGEGNFSTNSKSPRVVANQVQKEPLVRLQAMFGGSLRPVKPVKGRQPQWVWVLYSSSAVGVMMTLYSLMSPLRKDQIRKVLETWRASPRKPYRSHLRRAGYYGV